MKALKALLVFLLMAGSARASISAIYYGPTSAGSANGTSCANAYAYNDGTNGWTVSGKWGSGGTQIGPGTTLTVCQGTYTFSNGGNGLAVLNSGTSGGGYITIQGDPAGTVTFQAGYLGSGNPFSTNCGPASSCQGGIQIYQQNYIIVDGGKNFVIQNTSNGTGLTNSTGSTGVFVTGADHVIIRGLNILNIYQNLGSSPSATDSGGIATENIQVLGPSTNIAIYNNTINSSRIGISSTTDTSTGPNSCPTPNGTIGVTANPPGPPTGNWGTCIYNNTLSDHAWMIQSSGYVENIYANEWGDNTVSNGGTLSGWLNWQYPATYYHQNGWFGFGGFSPSGGVIAYLYNNYSHGDLGQGSPTGHMSCNSDGTTLCSMIAFNNIIVQTSSSANPGDVNQDQLFSIYIPSGTTGFGPFSFYNNTLSGGAYAVQIYTQNSGQTNVATFNWQNNIWSVGSLGSQAWYTNESNGGTVMTVGTINHNLYYNGRTSGGAWQLNNSTYSSLSAWQAACSCDASPSTVAAPNLNSSYVPNTGSPAIGLGTSLTGLSITALNSDAAGVARSTWDAGAYQYSTPPPSIPSAPAPQMFVWNGTLKEPITLSLSGSNAIPTSVAAAANFKVKCACTVPASGKISCVCQ